MKGTEEFEHKVLYKLWRNTCFGRGHMLIDNLVNGFPNGEANDVHNAIDQLSHRNWIVKKPTKHGTAVYINTNYRHKIEQELKRRYPYI
ncbi:MAG TPA: hypothetical protein DSN98_08000 [Thermoplasmata archaeon]|nr:MAG TPA: hypothetical protein DSN98_08000 [Thermoplasmata archaeon]